MTDDDWRRIAAEVDIEWCDDPPRNAHDKVMARCLNPACGHEWLAVGLAVSNQRRGCPRCSYRRAGIASRTSIEDWDHHARALNIEWTGERPTSQRTHAEARCLNPDCGHTWMAYSGSIVRGSGCPACAHYGFSVSKPALVYLLRLGDPPLLKIGVTNSGRSSDRVQVHRQRGWGVVRTWQVPDGRTALDVEQAVLKWWRDRNAVFASRNDVPKGHGFSETIHIGRVDAPDTMAFIRSLLR